MKSTKIKILQTIRQGKIGGGETHVLDLVSNLDKNLFECIVLSFTYGPMVDKLKGMGIKTYVIETEMPFNFLKWKAVENLMLSEQIDVVHAHGSRANSNVFYAAKALNIPLIYTVHGWSFHPDQSSMVKKFRILSEKFLVKKADLTICVSQSNLEDGKKLFPMPKAKVIKCGINFSKFDINGIYDDVRSGLSIGTDTILVGYVVRMTKQKDPLTLINAIALIAPEKDTKFLLVGDGELKEEAIALVDKLGLSAKIIFLDFTENVPAVLNALDIYCLPSLWEGLPLGMLEAMAMKTAVIVSSIDGAIEVINDGENGLLVEPKNINQLANAISTLADDPHLRSRLATNGYNTVVKDFDISKMINAISNTYTAIINKS